MSRYEYIDSCRSDPTELNPVTKMCAWLLVSTSGFYHWLTRPQSATAARRQALMARVEAFFENSDGTYGYRRIHADLAEEGTECSPELVRQIMRTRGWSRASRARSGSPPRPTSRPRRACRTWWAATSPRIVSGVKFVGDITYIHTWAGFIYLATVIDCYSKKVVGWSIADHMRTELVEDALRNAAATTLIEPLAVFHSDRGSVYTLGRLPHARHRLGGAFLDGQDRGVLGQCDG